MQHSLAAFKRKYSMCYKKHLEVSYIKVFSTQVGWLQFTYAIWYQPINLALLGRLSYKTEKTRITKVRGKGRRTKILKEIRFQRFCC